MKKMFEIKGHITIETDKDYWDAFIEVLEANGMTFGGFTNETSIEERMKNLKPVKPHCNGNEFIFTENKFIICLTDKYSGFTKGKRYEIYEERADESVHIGVNDEREAQWLFKGQYKYE